MADPKALRERALELFGNLDELEEPETLLMPILIDAVVTVEADRRVRHQVLNLPELTLSVDALLKELENIERTKRWAEEAARLRRVCKRHTATEDEPHEVLIQPRWPPINAPA
jgi:hypothetical protein